MFNIFKKQPVETAKKSAFTEGTTEYRIEKMIRDQEELTERLRKQNDAMIQRVNDMLYGTKK